MGPASHLAHDPQCLLSARQCWTSTQARPPAGPAQVLVLQSPRTSPPGTSFKPFPKCFFSEPLPGPLTMRSKLLPRIHAEALPSLVFDLLLLASRLQLLCFVNWRVATPFQSFLHHSCFRRSLKLFFSAVSLCSAFPCVEVLPYARSAPAPNPALFGTYLHLF